MAVGTNIRKLRKKHKLSQEDLASVLNLSRVSVLNIEVGRHAITIESLVVLAKYFGANYNSILPDAKKFVLDTSQIKRRVVKIQKLKKQQKIKHYEKKLRELKRKRF